MRETADIDSALAVRATTTASRTAVWDVLADGWTYSQWVVGNSRMRAVDEAWPAPGTTIHHTIGVWPVALDDETEVHACVPVTELVLLAKGRPLGAARITMRLSDADGGCLMEMAEVPLGGPLSAIPQRIALAAAWPRNRECLRRLTALAERRTRPE